MSIATRKRERIRLPFIHKMIAFETGKPSGLWPANEDAFGSEIVLHHPQDTRTVNACNISGTILCDMSDKRPHADPCGKDARARGPT